MIFKQLLINLENWKQKLKFATGSGIKGVLEC